MGGLVTVAIFLSCNPNRAAEIGSYTTDKAAPVRGMVGVGKKGGLFFTPAFHGLN